MMALEWTIEAEQPKMACHGAEMYMRGSVLQCEFGEGLGEGAEGH